MTASITLEGYALHRGVVTRVALVRAAGPITFERDGRRASLADLAVTRSDGGVAVSDGRGLEIDLVEHLLAAFGGLGIRAGVRVVVEGAELPILDGGARRFSDALLALALPFDEGAKGTAECAAGERGAPRETGVPRNDVVPRDHDAGLLVTKTATLLDGKSLYAFEVGDGTEMSVETTFEHPAIDPQNARWDGSRRAFLDSIATARTFGFQADARELWKRGRAELATRTSDPSAMRAFAHAVVVFDETGAVTSPGEPPPSNGEIARHKLLDLIGDFALYGGPPRGRVFARRPGHTASHRIVREALSLGILSRR